MLVYYIQATPEAALYSVVATAYISSVHIRVWRWACADQVHVHVLQLQGLYCCHLLYSVITF